MSTPNMQRTEPFPVSSRFLPPPMAQTLRESLEHSEPETFLRNTVQGMVHDDQLPPYFMDLMKVEQAVSQADGKHKAVAEDPPTPLLNPTLQLLEVAWSGLAEFFKPDRQDPPEPEPGAETLMVWKPSATDTVRVQKAHSEDLVALKIAAEDLEIRDLAEAHQCSPLSLQGLIARSGRMGLLILPRPTIRRGAETLGHNQVTEGRFLAPKVFTLQWHLTQACDLNCKHCYDRSPRSPLKQEQAFWIEDELERFCLEHRVQGKITFSGGNPLLYPHFEDVYRRAARKGFALSILGNPAPRRQIEALAAIQHPSSYQVSLEGLEAHNDHIREPGHFQRTLAFLELLAELKIPSQVMLTLTRDNMDQVLPLAERLRGLTGNFTFNRLSPVGQGAELLLPTKDEYESFLREYRAAAKTNPVLGIKDNLINILRRESGHRPFGGCTGFGCGAAFNFAALLPDGEVHACRKFPSWIGNIFQTSLQAIFDSDQARGYRAGSSACAGCNLRPVCGGCQAVVSGLGMDPGRDLDPYCFYSQKPPQSVNCAP